MGSGSLGQGLSARSRCSFSSKMMEIIFSVYPSGWRPQEGQIQETLMFAAAKHRQQFLPQIITEDKSMVIQMMYYL